MPIGTILFEGVEYGLNDEGFTVMPQPVCERYTLSRLEVIYGDQIAVEDIDTDGRFGQLIQGESEQLAINFEIAQSVYKAGDPDESVGAALYANCRIVGVNVNLGTFTKVDVLLSGTIGTVVAAGKLVSISGDPKFELLDETEIEAGGTLAPFQALKRGIVKALAGQINIIETPVTGWTGVTNPADAVIGSEKELDSALRVRRREQVTSGGSGRVDVIYRKVSNIQGITEVFVFENDTDDVDERGQPPGTLEVVVDDGLDSDVAQVLWDNKPGATRYVGNIEYEIIDSQGFPHTMRWSRITFVAIYVTYEIEVDETFPYDGEDQIKANTVERGDALGRGVDVTIPFLQGNLADIPGILSEVIYVGLAPDPTESDNIPISDTQRSDFDTSRTIVNFTP